MYIMKKERKNYFDPMTHRVQLLRSMLQCTLACWHEYCGTLVCLCAQHALQRDTLACSRAQCALQRAMLLHTTVHAKKLVPQRVGVSIGSHRLGSRIKEERRNRHKDTVRILNTIKPITRPFTVMVTVKLVKYTGPQASLTRGITQVAR